MALRNWVQPTQSKATYEDANDPALGWTAQNNAGPNHHQAYNPWATGYRFVEGNAVANPANAATAATATTGGTLAAATYVYAYSWVGPKGGETTTSPTVSQATSGSTSTVTLTLPALPSWAVSANVYRQVAGVLKLVGTSATTSFVDNGSVTPVLVAPSTSTAAYTEVNH